MTLSSKNKTYLLILLSIGALILGGFLLKGSHPQEAHASLRITNPYSNPQKGDNWTINFQTKGTGTLKVIPQDTQTNKDTQFISLTCQQQKKEPSEINQQTGTLTYRNWHCPQEAILTYLVKTANEHSFKLTFQGQEALAHNSPDTLTDAFTNTNLISSTSTVTVDTVAGNIKLEETKANGASCSAGGECDSGNCIDGYCCNTTCVGTCAACNLSGSEGTCTNVPAGQDPDSECTAITCTNYIYGWSGNNCLLYLGASANNGDCNGSGACSTVAQSCTGAGSTSASCGSTGCKNACPANAVATSYDTIGEVCYTSLQHSCSVGYTCNVSGTCEFSCAAAGKGAYTVSGDTVYCDNYNHMWTITANVDGAAATKQWYTSNTDTANSCIGLGASYEACNYCDTLTYGGYSDWELPSCTNDDNLPSSCVLYQLGESACGWAGTDGSETSCTPSWDTHAQSNNYWSSTEYQSSTDHAWSVYFGNGNVSYYGYKSNYNYVRCIRGQ